MWPAAWEEGAAAWSFDPSSALIGAVATLLLAIILYSWRQRLRTWGDRLWSPVTRWRRHSRASQEEKYLTALMARLRGLMLFAPAQPEVVIQPPSYLVPPQIPTHLTEAARLPEPFPVPHDQLLDGYARIVITGPLGSGKTTALLMRVCEAKSFGQADPSARLPVWVDLLHVRRLGREHRKVKAPLERLVDLAVLEMPEALPKWLLGRLRKSRSLILVDNWEQLAADERQAVALLLGELAQELPQSAWLVACGPEGYGALVEVGFVPVELVPASGRDAALTLCEGWAKLLGRAPVELSGELIDGLEQSSRAGASPLEMALRAAVICETGRLPKRPVDVIDTYLNLRLPVPDLGEDHAETAQQARLAALRVVAQVARTHRLEGKELSRQEILNLISAFLPKESERSAKLEGTVRRLVVESKLLRRDGSHWVPAHYLWDEFLTAWSLAQEPGSDALLEAHLDDPGWALLLEFYAGLGDAERLARSLLKRAACDADPAVLLRAGRWAAVAPQEAPWRKVVLKALAQTFVRSDIDRDVRLDIGWALAVNAGDAARAYFLQVLRDASTEIRTAALRGLGWTGTAREVGLLTAALSAGEFPIREAAVLALQDLGTPGAMRALGEAFSAMDDRTGLVAAQALATHAEGHAVLQNAARSPDLLVRRAVAYGLGTVDEAWAAEVLECLAREDPEWLVRSAAAAALSQAEQSDGRQVVSAPPQPDQVEWLVRWAANQGMGLGVGEAALEQLRRAVSEGDTEAKLLGTLTLTQIGREEHLGILRELVETSDPALRSAAVSAVKTIERRYRTPDSRH